MPITRIDKNMTIAELRAALDAAESAFAEYANLLYSTAACFCSCDGDSNQQPNFENCLVSIDESKNEFLPKSVGAGHIINLSALGIDAKELFEWPRFGTPTGPQSPPEFFIEPTKGIPLRAIDIGYLTSYIYDHIYFLSMKEETFDESKPGVSITKSYPVTHAYNQINHTEDSSFSLDDLISEIGVGPDRYFDVLFFMQDIVNFRLSPLQPLIVAHGQRAILLPSWSHDSNAIFIPEGVMLPFSMDNDGKNSLPSFEKIVKFIDRYIFAVQNSFVLVEQEISRRDGGASYKNGTLGDSPEDRLDNSERRLLILEQLAAIAGEKAGWKVSKPTHEAMRILMEKKNVPAKKIRSNGRGKNAYFEHLAIPHIEQWAKENYRAPST